MDGITPDPRITRIWVGIAETGELFAEFGEAALADLRAWQEIAECKCGYLCRQRKLADAAIDRMYELWGKP